jgi:hypothetical protein
MLVKTPHSSVLALDDLDVENLPAKMMSKTRPGERTGVGEKGG